jgi:arsenite methyltransferase
MSSNHTATEENVSQAHACGCGSGGCGSHSQENEERGSFELLQAGDRVVDLGSGLGHESINMARIVGPTGKVTGIDISPENLAAAKALQEENEITNLEFIQGSIDAIPLPNESADVIYANCVFNLQVNRQKVADEMYRVCDHNGFVCVSDYVLINDIPDGIRQETGELMGCVFGAEDVRKFMSYFQQTGFTKGGIVEVNKVRIPDDILTKYLSPEQVKSYNDAESDDGIFQVVLVVEKPETCESDTCCCNPEKHQN